METMARIIIVTESGADLPKEFIQENNIYVRRANIEEKNWKLEAL